ncbi:MAG: hypothetical protein ACPGWR_04280 [Ardenticatenaceae bacterium]
MTTSREWAQLIAKAWVDEEFQRIIEKDIEAALKQNDIETAGVLQVPPRPEGLKDEKLKGNYTFNNYDDIIPATTFTNVGGRGAFPFTKKALTIKNANLIQENEG